MAVTRTPRKKTGTTEAAKASKAAPKKPAEKAAPAKRAAGKPAPKKAPVKKPAAKAVEAEAKPVRKAKTVAPPEPEPQAIPAPAAPVEAKPKATPRPAAKKASGSEPALSPIAEIVLTAIREGRALEFIFEDAEANAPRTFEPRQLTFDALSQAWYVWGWDRRYNAERFHRLDLLAEANPVEGVGRSAQGPYAEDTPANQIGGWLGGEPIAVKALLMKQWVFAVKQAPPAFPHFHMEDQGDGQALVSFTATDLRAIARWVLQFGDGIQVLEPARLQDRIKQVAAVWMGRDRQAAPPARAEGRHESRQEARPEPRAEARPEPRSEPRAPRPEPAQEPRRHESRPAREPRREQDEDAPKGKPGKLEIIRFDRL